MLNWIKDKKQKVEDKFSQRVKKQIYLSVIAISTVLILSLVGFNAHSNRVFAETARQDMEGMITSLDTMSSSVNETQRVVQEVYTVKDDTQTVSQEETTTTTDNFVGGGTESNNSASKEDLESLKSDISDAKSEIEDTIKDSKDGSDKDLKDTNDRIKGLESQLKEVITDISGTKKEIQDALNKMDTSNSKDLKETYEKIGKDFEKTSELYSTSMDEVKLELTKLSTQSKEQYDSTIEQISAVQTLIENSQRERDTKNEQNTNTIIEKIDLFGTSLRNEINTYKTNNDTRVAELENEVSQLKTKVNNADTYYPVGSLYLSVTETNPADIYGGEWVKIAQGQTLIGSSDAYALGSTGGNESITLTQANIPSYDLIVNDPGHTHNLTDPGHEHTGTITGGNHRHAATVGGPSTNNINAHSAFDGNTYGNGTLYTGWSGDLTFNATIQSATTGITIDGATTGITVNSGGSGEAISVMQPYLAVNIWQRIA